MTDIFWHKPSVSVTMVVRRPHPRFFPQAVQSILRQTLADLELIIIEDPSDRSAQRLLAGFNDNRIRFFGNLQRTSQVEQRNRALCEARSGLVANLDADDIAEPTRLKKQSEFLLAHPEVAVVGSQICVIDEEGSLRGHRSFPLDHESIYRALSRVVPINHPSVMFRKSAILAVGGYPSNQYRVAEDYLLWTLLALNGARFANLPEPLVRYRIHAEQTKATHLRKMIRAVLETKTLHWRGRMSMRGRLRMFAERCLLWLPEKWVLNLLLRVNFCDSSVNSTRELLRQPEGFSLSLEKLL